MYNLRVQPKAENFLKKLDKSTQVIIIKKLHKIKEAPYSGKALVGNLSGLWRVRANKYRIIYEIIEHKLIVVVIKIGHRKDIY